ncbi:MAG: response regulator [Anaerolineae bacterium]
MDAQETLRPPLILIVEDSPTQAKAEAMFLTDIGFDVIVASDGPDGLMAAAEYQPNVIILDVKLPTMSGFQVVRRLKRHPQTDHIPVIMLTKLDNTSDMTVGLNQGADYYIPKGERAAEELKRTLSGFGLIAWH